MASKERERERGGDLLVFTKTLIFLIKSSLDEYEEENDGPFPLREDKQRTLDGIGLTGIEELQGALESSGSVGEQAVHGSLLREQLVQIFLVLFAQLHRRRRAHGRRRRAALAARGGSCVWIGWIHGERASDR